MDINGIMLSIYVATYGHEKYIKEALDSILMQETKYAYEVLIGEDASPDHTREILKEYEKKYPGKFQIFYRKTNMYNSSYTNAMDLRSRCKGKYMIALEGDDFWIDAKKLEKQIDFLENHPQYVAVAHNCIIVDKNSKPTGQKYPECKDLEYTLKHYASDILPGQLTTVMYRNPNKNQIDMSILSKGLSPGDRLIYFALACQGNIYCIQECMSAYRYVTDSGTSFSATYHYDYLKEKKWYRTLIEYAVSLGNKEAEKIAQMLYLRNVVHGLKIKQLAWGEFFKEIKKGKLSRGSFYLYIKQYINHHLLKKQIWL